MRPPPDYALGWRLMPADRRWAVDNIAVRSRRRLAFRSNDAWLANSMFKMRRDGRLDRRAKERGRVQ